MSVPIASAVKIISYFFQPLIEGGTIYTSSPRLEISWGGVRLGKRILTLNRKEDEKTTTMASPLPCWKSVHNAKKEKVSEEEAF